MNKIPIVFTFDKRIILGAAVAIKSLIDNAKQTTFYDIYVYHPDIAYKTIKYFEEMLSNTNHSISFYHIHKYRFKDAPINKGGSWTEIVYYRLLIPELLPQYDKAIYIDVDVLFKKDLSEVFNIDISGYECAAVPVELNSNKMICHKYFPENKNKYIYISSFLVMNLKLMREEKTVQKFLEVISSFNKRLKFFDLDTLNIACDRFYDLPFSYGTFQSIFYKHDVTKAGEYPFLMDIYSIEELEKAKKETVFIHYVGKPGKPWRMKKPYIDYKEYINKIPKKLKKYTFRDIRKKLLSKY
ncbi:glycosyl transferase [Francisella persica ATCC VR-331]|uniref:Glycosyl transferase n=1 Tax=Francisella persica ATCC VR-331 TaxID=1086726 RepID=A0AAC8VE92_9GAMM|nr:glycosyltransferase family 8 protein [Francisella persica]ALB01873.1 glycosyl transferase [Francisella persica ATCC VR-331]ANH77125.1 glycosyl transferase [Francisella persica ATCC VR-331]